MMIGDADDKLCGFLDRKKCTECGSRLTGLKKISHYARFGQVVAKVCVNKKCWHYVHIGDLETWMLESSQFAPPAAPPGRTIQTRVEHFYND